MRACVSHFIVAGRKERGSWVENMYLESEDFRLCEGKRFAVHFNETFALLRRRSVF